MLCHDIQNAVFQGYTRKLSIFPIPLQAFFSKTKVINMWDISYKSNHGYTRTHHVTVCHSTFPIIFKDSVNVCVNSITQKYPGNHQ